MGIMRKVSNLVMENIIEMSRTFQIYFNSASKHGISSDIDSRELILLIPVWASEFEKKYPPSFWEEENPHQKYLRDYYGTIDEFVLAKMKEQFPRQPGEVDMDNKPIDWENAYSARGLAVAFQSLDESGAFEIKKVQSGGWDELLPAIKDLLLGMKCDYQIIDSQNLVQINTGERITSQYQMDVLIDAFGVSPEEPIKFLQCSDCKAWSKLEHWICETRDEPFMSNVRGLKCPKCGYFHSPFDGPMRFSAN